MQLDAAVIVSSGFATRMPIATRNGLLPKCLVSFHYKPIAYWQLRYWRNFAKEVHFVVRSEHNNAMLCYARDFEYSGFFLSSCDEKGNTNAIGSLRKELIGKHVAIQWADILLQEALPAQLSKSEAYCLTDRPSLAHRYRHIPEEKRIVHDNTANADVAGLFICPELPDVSLLHEGIRLNCDFADVFGDAFRGNINGLSLAHEDIGTDDKWLSHCSLYNGNYTERF